MKRTSVKLMLLLLLATIGYLLVKHGKSCDTTPIQKLEEKTFAVTTVDEVFSKPEDRLKRSFEFSGIVNFPQKLIIVALKEEQLLQVYVKEESTIKFLKEYPFTDFSGTLGPKLRVRDGQIPEGIYGIEYLNPNSNYHLSLKINYPNKFDKSKSELDNHYDMGGDIFIHGKDVTIGCIPIGDRAIEELFYLAENVELGTIKVIISPWDLRVRQEFPEIESIDWEDELYEKIKAALDSIPVPTQA